MIEFLARARTAEAARHPYADLLREIARQEGLASRFRFGKLFEFLATTEHRHAKNRTGTVRRFTSIQRPQTPVAVAPIKLDPIM